MKRILPVLLFLMFVSIAFAGSKHSGFTKHYEDSLFQITENKLYSVEIVIKEHELRVGMNKVDVILHDRNDKDVVGAEIEFVPWMPDMGHGVRTKPVIKEKGGGLYYAEQVELSMQGLWELRITVSKDGVTDKAVFSFPDVKKGEGHHEHAKVDMAKLDISTKQMTERYSVSYKSDTTPLPINKIISWELSVKTHDGKPVTEADVFIDGDMPAHGHGFPTEPEVTDEIEDGVYLVEGIKFSMPGHWVVTFMIEVDGKKDTATFNVILQ